MLRIKTTIKLDGDQKNEKIILYLYLKDQRYKGWHGHAEEQQISLLMLKIFILYSQQIRRENFVTASDNNVAESTDIYT